MVALEWKGWNWRGREEDWGGGVHADLPQKKGEEWGECNHMTRNARTNSDFAVCRDLVKINILSKRSPPKNLDINNKGHYIKFW